ncbi:hypothetical protein OsJ_05668 [Oryza sativa Japonica Group]|uniref:Serine-threonine/tyrosine-protein kinase catalytic domain-containing protein n=2 Tax=Oryza sativa TaxID=4530 RepID=A3A3X3_ORYSJ|nr:hypothetical protein OsJ_05668 [Oryza sativa Japonica Group]
MGQIAVKRLKSWSNKAETEFAIEVEVLATISSSPSDTTYHSSGYQVKQCSVGQEFPSTGCRFWFCKAHSRWCNPCHYKGEGYTSVTLAPEYAMLGKASESCDVFSFGVLLLELASGKRPVEKLNPTTKLTITEWALPLARDKKFKEIADPKLKDVFVEAELKRMVLVGLACSQNKQEQRPIMSEVVELLKGESAEKLSNLENDEMFKPDLTSSFQDSSHSSHPDSSDCITEEKNSKADTIDEAVDSSETVPSAR